MFHTIILDTKLVHGLRTLEAVEHKNDQTYEVDTMKEKRTREHIKQAAERNSRWTQ
jgi:hypothetical protein